MYRITLDDCSGYFLDHRQLIKQSYEEKSSFYGTTCELKPDLFKYTEKETPSDVVKRKRPKRKSESDLESPPPPPPESLESFNHVQQFAEKLIEESRKHIPQLPEEAATIDINEIIADKPVYSKMNIRQDFNYPLVMPVKEKHFLMPPKSAFHTTDIRNLDDIFIQDEKFDFIVIDPPWRNKYIRRLKKVREDLSYTMMYNEELAEIPLNDIIYVNTLVVIWCTNSKLHQRAIMETFLPKWDLKFLAKWYWIKLNHKGELICPFKGPCQKQPFEQLFIATHKDNTTFHFKEEFIVSVASVIHSHKPPLFEIFRSLLPTEPDCLELFARYLYPGFTSVGFEVLKLQDTRIYNLHNKQTSYSSQENES